MTLATSADVLQPALKGGWAIGGLVCLGWEDARAYVTAAEEEGVPVILQAGPGARAHMPISVWGAMFRSLAREVSVPVVAHLDHGYSLQDCRAALDAGFTSLMFDGSRLPLADNIAQTRAVVQLAHAAGISCEGEIGFVGYDGGAASNGTDPKEAAQFASETGVDAMAISVGNVHFQQDQGDGLDRARIAQIEAESDVPLVIHGGSGVADAERRLLARESAICKFNIGTELRQVFGAQLRQVLAEDHTRFDRIAILGALEPALVTAARKVLKDLSKPPLSPL